jgi:hypothetical protein
MTDNIIYTEEDRIKDMIEEFERRIFILQGCIATLRVQLIQILGKGKEEAGEEK